MYINTIMKRKYNNKVGIYIMHTVNIVCYFKSNANILWHEGQTSTPSPLSRFFRLKDFKSSLVVWFF